MPDLHPGAPQTFVLPLTKGKVTVQPLVLAEELDQSLPLEEGLEAAEKVETLTRHIVSWDFVDRKGNSLPVTDESVLKLPVEDYRFLMRKLKTSSPLTKSQKQKLFLYLDNREQGINSSFRPPLSYLIYQYRQAFHVSWREAVATPLSVILQDLKFREIESQIANKNHPK